MHGTKSKREKWSERREEKMLNKFIALNYWFVDLVDFKIVLLAPLWKNFFFIADIYTYVTVTLWLAGHVFKPKYLSRDEGGVQQASRDKTEDP